MVGIGFDDRAQIQAGHAQLLQIGEFCADAGQIPAEEIIVEHLPVDRFVLRLSAPVPAGGLALHLHIVSRMTEAVDKGVESWNISLKFTPTGVSLIKLTDTTQDLLTY